MISEQTPTGGFQLESDSAEAYERYLVPAIFRPSADRLVDRVGIEPGERVLDVGCGTGIVARTAAARGAHAAGVDLNEGMLAVARSAAPEVDWRTGDAAALPFDDGTFDVVLSQQALQFMPDPIAALREMRRVLAAGGRMAVVVCRSLDRNAGYEALAAAIERHTNADVGTGARSPFPAWGVAELRAMIGDAGFADVHVSIDLAGVRYPSAEGLLTWEVASSPLAQVFASLRQAAVGRIVAEVARAVGDYADDDGVLIPLETLVAVARR
jgi:ubiquinone/menaquinone biosynthesis C-methylase UbiE